MSRFQVLGFGILLAIALGERRVSANCFTKSCESHNHFFECLGGTWQCQPDEYCDVSTHVSITAGSPWVTMACRPKTGHSLSLEVCQARSNMNELSCNPHDHSQQCHWCCEDEGCMANLNTLYPNHYITTTKDPSEVCEDMYVGDCAVDFAGRCNEGIVSEICLKTCGHCPVVCRDQCKGDCCLNFADKCSDPVVHGICRKTCGFCDELTCQDKYTGNCSETFAGRCSQYSVQMLCQKTCQACDLTKTTPVPCEDEYIGDCSVDFAGMCNDPAIHQVCKRTCGTCDETSASTAATAPMTRTIPPDVVTTIPPDTMRTTGMTTRVTESTTQVTTVRRTSPTTTTTLGPPPSTTPTTTLPPPTSSTLETTTEEGCQDLYIGDCQKDLAGGCSNSFVQTVCQKTCNLCSSTTTASHLSLIG